MPKRMSMVFVKNGTINRDPTGRRLGRGDEVVGYAADLRAQYGLRTPDVLQIAAAKTANCQVFLTNDKALSV